MMYIVYRHWVDGSKERLLVVLDKQEAEEECLLYNNKRLPWSLRAYKYEYEEVESLVHSDSWYTVSPRYIKVGSGSEYSSLVVDVS